MDNHVKPLAAAFSVRDFSVPVWLSRSAFDYEIDILRHEARERVKNTNTMHLSIVMVETPSGDDV